MEELTAIKTAEGREFKPWATKDDVQDPASVTAIASEIASGKQAIAEAINAKGGTASATESFSELAQAVGEIPNYSDMVKLAGIIAGGNYDKNALQGHNENVKYGKTEIVDRVGAFEKINISRCFQYWDLLEKIEMPNLTTIFGNNIFDGCSSLININIPNCRELGSASGRELANIRNLTNLVVGKLDRIWGSSIQSSGSHLRNITIGQDTNINLPFSSWTATNVIAEVGGIDELNNNLYNNLLTKLYDHSQDGQTRTLSLGWLANVTQENIAYANAKGWTLTT